MKRIVIIIIFPLVLFALERVNLIRNGGFENEDDVWVVETGASGFPNPAIGSLRDDSTSGNGILSASGDTRQIPTWSGGGLYDSVAIRQNFLTPKITADLDSLSWHQLIVLLSPVSFLSSDLCLLGFTYSNPESNGFGYGFINPQGTTVVGWIDISEKIGEEHTFWSKYEKSIHRDFIEQGLVNPNQEINSFVLNIWGEWFGNDWHGQKVSLDDVRLMGYADYDVGVKEITSGDAETPYTPEARIKNFGREPADSFLVIAEISKNEITHQADTLPWSLPADTEDTVSFSDFIPPDTGIYTLRIYTVMEPDESDEDNELTKELHFTAIAEPVTPVKYLDLKVNPISTDKVCASFALPQSRSGTIVLYDISGKRIESKSIRGYGSVTFNGELSAGVYIVRLESGGFKVTRKVLIIK